jgi:phosphatidylethanolamine-binding protein (PEBP) family uncharacterized protein
MKKKYLIGLMFAILGFGSACASVPSSKTTETATAIVPTQEKSPVIPPTAIATPIVSPTKVSSAVTTIPTTNFVLKSSQVVEGGTLPRDYTCDGSSATLPLEWDSAPSGTKNFAVVMHHIPPEITAHWYWIVYNIPSNVTNFPKNVKGIGTLGNNSVNGKTEYTPPCSKGPGEKIYTYTVYALSDEPQLTAPTSKVSRDVLLAAIKDITLASAQLNVTYSR